MLEPSGDGSGRVLDGMSSRQRPASQSVTNTPAAQFGRVVRQRSRRRRASLWAVFVVPVVAVLAVAGWFLWPRGTNHKLSAINLATSVIKSSVGQRAKLAGETDGRTNFLVYGMTKDGLRTDSIMLASYYWNEHKLATLNIPRDLQVNDGYETVKFGEVFAYAYMRNKKDDRYPSQYVANLVAKEYGLPINYWVKLNMQGEVSLINTLGGVDISVEKSFTDYQYPTWNYSGYIHPAPHFNAGLQHMTGDTALIYSRSRHSLDNGEGSDFARSKRQMLVLAAVMTKVKALGIIGNIADISHYLTILGDNVDTNMSTDEMVAFASTAKALNPDTDLVRGNWSTENGFLCSATSAIGAYITLYGQMGTCNTSAGAKTTSKARELAIYYVSHLLESAPLATADYIAQAGPKLPAPYTTSSTQVLSAQASPTPTPLH